MVQTGGELGEEEETSSLWIKKKEKKSEKHETEGKGSPVRVITKSQKKKRRVNLPGKRIKSSGKARGEKSPSQGS